MLAAVVAISVTVAVAGAQTAPPAPNPPPIEQPTPIEPRPDEPAPPGPSDLTPSLPPKSDGKDGNGKPGHKKKAPVPEVSTGGLGEGPCWGATAGCGVAGCLPAIGTALGAGVFVTSISAALAQGGGALGTCFGVGVATGIVVGAPSAIVLGPCASGGALAGGITGALLDDRDLAPVFLGALPGLATGLLASGTAVWGLAVLSASSGDFQTPALILGTSAALAFAAGPVTIAGISIGDGIAGDHPRNGEPLLKNPLDNKKDDDAADVSDVVSHGVMAF